MQTQTGMEATELDKNEIYLSSGQKYRNEWNHLKGILDSNLDKLRNLAFNGDLKVSKFRSICWSILLRVLSSNPLDWPAQREQQRKRYQKLKEEFVKNPHNNNLTNDNPLSQSKQSVWNQYFGDQELFSIIKQDVVRTFPGVDFFRKLFVQEAMTNILFYYSREHPYMSYRQGMHEILAPILFVIYYDHQSLLHFKELSEDIDKLLIIVLDPEYLEQDCYSIFSRLMSSIESYYRITNLIPTTDGYFPTEKFNEESQQLSEVEVIGQLNIIRDKILAKEDPHLHSHLQKLDIPLHIFGIRWLRLLFGREFPLLDLLMLWDAIFAESDKFQLPNYILVAMLIRIRDKLILSDYTSCLTYLMRYPNNVDLSLILRHALHMHYPNKFEQPLNAFIYIKIENEEVKFNSKQQFSRQIAPNTLPKHKRKSLKGSSFEGDFQNHPNISERTRSASLLLKKDKGENSKYNEIISNNSQNKKSINPNIEDLQLTNVHNLTQIENLKFNQKSDEHEILDSYSDETPEYLRLQLYNAQTIISVSRLKLGKYLETLRKYSTKGPEELCQAVDGIEELCAFLDVKSLIHSTIPLQIDSALEANESPQKLDKIIATGASEQITFSSSSVSSFVHVNSDNSKSTNVQINKLISSNSKRNSAITEPMAKTEFVKSLEANYKNPYEIEIGEEGNTVDFQKLSKNFDDCETSTSSPKKNNTRYEIPDTGFMHKSYKILGSRRDVELTLIKEKRISSSEEGLPKIDPLNLKTDFQENCD